MAGSWYARPGSREAARYGLRTAAISSGVRGDVVMGAPGSAERHGLLRVEERDGSRLRRPDPAVGRHDLELVAGAGQLDRDPHVADVPLEPRRPDQVGDRPDRLAVGQRIALARELERERVALDLDADQLAADALDPDLLEGRLADVVRLLRLDQPLETHDLERVVVEGHVRAVVEDAGLDPPRLARGDRADVVGPAGVHDPVPQVTAARRISQVDLVADLAGPARPADDDRDAVDLRRHRPVVLDVVDAGAEHRPHDVPGLRALDLDRIDLGLAHADVHARMR